MRSVDEILGSASVERMDSIRECMERFGNGLSNCGIAMVASVVFAFVFQQK